MKHLFLTVLVMSVLTNACSQVSPYEKTLKQIEHLMNQYVSELNDVTHYTLSLKGNILDKETHLNGGDSHHRTYNLKNTDFTIEEHEIEPGAREFYDFITYWDVHIADNWIATEIYNKEDAERMIQLLNDLQKELK